MAACLGLLAVLALPHGAVGAGAAETLQIAVSRSPLSLPLYVAQEKGFFAAESLDVRLADCPSGARCLQSLFDGQADIATMSEMPVAINSFQRSDYAVIATIATTGHDLKLVADRRSGVRSTADLPGKRVGVVRGSAAQYFLDHYLLTADVDPHTLAIVFMPAEAQVAALRAREVDVLSVWEPHGYLAVQALGPNALVLPRLGAYVETFNLVAHRRLLGPRDAELTRLLRAVERGERFIQEQPDEAKAILQKRLGLDAGFIGWVWPTTSFRLGLDQTVLRSLESEARWAVREGHASGKPAPNFLGLFYTLPLMNAKPSAVNLGR